jgi:hypothetical protein
LNEFTGGYQTDYGGAFDIHNKKYEKQKYLKRDKRSPRITFIVPDITKIENLLDKKRLKNSLDRMNLVRLEGLGLIGGLAIPNNFKVLVDSDLQNNALLLSSPWKIYIAYDKDKHFHLPEQKVQELGRLDYAI